jgi:hypothetical protein
MRILGERIVPVAVIATVAICFILGLAAALIGGSLNSFGDGPGGLSGIPGLVLFLLCLAGIVGAIAFRGGVLWTAAVLAGPVLVATAFFFVAHLLDPCVTGTWDMLTEVAGGPACQFYGQYLNVAPRFHLLLHAIVAAPVALLYWLVLERARAAQQNAMTVPAQT